MSIFLYTKEEEHLKMSIYLLHESHAKCMTLENVGYNTDIQYAGTETGLINH